MSLKENLNVSEKIKKKYKAFSFPIEKEVIKTDKDGNEIVVTISYKTKFIDGERFIATSLSNLAHYLTESIYKIKCKDCDCFLEYESGKNNLIKYQSYFAIKIIQARLMKTFKGIQERI